MYTFWNVISDIGGLAGVLIYLAQKFLSVINFNKSEDSLVSQLFKMENLEVQIAKG